MSGAFSIELSQITQNYFQFIKIISFALAVHAALLLEKNVYREIKNSFVNALEEVMNNVRVSHKLLCSM